MHAGGERAREIGGVDDREGKSLPNFHELKSNPLGERGASTGGGTDKME